MEGAQSEALLARAQDQGDVALLALVPACYAFGIIDAAFGSARDGFGRDTLGVPMAMTVTLLVILCLVAAVIPLVAMARYDAATEPEAREVIGRAPVGESAGELGWGRSLVMPAGAFALGIVATMFTTGSLQLLEPLQLGEVRAAAIRAEAQRELIARQLATMQRLEQELRAIQSMSANSKVELKKLSETVERDRARLQSELRSTRGEWLTCNERSGQVCANRSP